ncbi:hypothetical protein CYY_001707 [Polysphondylium violaceum]|uniref:Uncharacterized protein n=1 Tax=Polysphondylium violaceum TaxID=133409 RepID=A0A8J4PXW6_9MYCE|nr:hypothetical protein CYY_001707 [Polysphondylium violaceum]
MIKNSSKLIIPFVQRSLRTSSTSNVLVLNGKQQQQYNNKSLLISSNNGQNQLYRYYTSQEQRLDEKLSVYRDEYEQEDNDDRDEYADEDRDTGKELEDIDEEEEFFEDIGETLCDIHNLCLDHPLPLFKEVRYQLHSLHNEDKSFWTVERLSKVFKIHPGRVVALIRFVDIEHKELADGKPLYTEIEDLICEEMGMRIHDEYLGEDEHQKEDDHEENSSFSFQNGLATNIEHLHNAYKDNPAKKQSLKKKNKSNKSNKPDPLHEIPTQIPENYPEQPIYFRGPTFVVPRKKNVVFVDTSRDPFTKKINPDPMVLIQGIDGSIRTPSSEEKHVIMDRVRPKKAPRDYNSLLNRPLRYKLDAEKYPSQKKKYELPDTDDKSKSTTTEEGGEEATQNN